MSAKHSEGCSKGKRPDDQTPIYQNGSSMATHLSPTIGTSSPVPHPQSFTWHLNVLRLLLFAVLGIGSRTSSDG